MTDRITSAGCCDCALGRPCDVHPKREAFTSNERSLRVALGLLGDAMNHGPGEPVFALIAEARDTIESSLRVETNGDLLPYVEGRLVRAESELLSLGCKVLDRGYWKQFPDPYIPGSPVKTAAEHTIPCPMCKTPLAARRLDYKCKLCFGTVVFGDSICPITGELHEALPEVASGHATFSNEQISDDAIRSLWRSAGGKFHGPNVETGTIPEAKLLPFLRSLGAVKKQVPDPQAKNEQSAEQHARDVLTRLGIEGADSFTAGDLAELANLIADGWVLRAPRPEPLPPRVCADSADGQHVLKQDGPFSVVYCDACGMNRGWRTQEPENRSCSGGEA